MQKKVCVAWVNKKGLGNEWEKGGEKGQEEKKIPEKVRINVSLLPVLSTSKIRDREEAIFI